MSETPASPVASRFLLTTACLVIVIAGLREAADALVVPFILSVFLAMLGVPPLGWLRRRGLPAPIAILVVVLGIVAVIGGLGAIVGTSATAFSQAVPQYQIRLERLLESVDTQFAQWEIGVSVATLAEDLINPGRAFQLATRLLTSLAGFLSDFLVVFLTMIFILTEAAGFPAKARAAFGAASGKLLKFGDVMTQVHHYLLIKSAISLGTGLALGIWVWILGVDFPVLWGLLAFLLNYIPNIGSMMAAVPPLLVSLIQPEGGLTMVLMVAIGYMVVNILLGNFIEPGLMGQQLGLSTLVVFVSLVFWGWVLGPVGMLLSVPLTMVAKILLENSSELRWVAVLLDKSPSARAEI
jgi:predicted PurR-regulated permease PerM